jgi:tRNA(fMet)-specific endonuclease VapC
MTLNVLDTDTLSLHERRAHPALSARIRSAAPGEVAVTVISVEEQLTGWYTMLRKARLRPDIARAYQRLAKSVESLSALRILPFPEPAIARYETLAAMKLNVAHMDLRIAAIALENGGTVVTRNLRDFQRVPGLSVVNWAV